MHSYDFLVIGAGIAGASASFELSAHGRIGLLERETAVGYHSTGRSAALLTENYGNEVIRQLTIASRKFLVEPPEGFAEHPLVQPRGALWIAEAGASGHLEHVYEQARVLVPSVRRLNVAQTRECCPAIREEFLEGGVLEPDAMDIDVAALHQGFLRGMKRRGGELHCGAEVESLHRRGGQWEVSTRDGDSFVAPVIINAAGAWADHVAALGGAEPIGIKPMRRTAIVFDPPSGVATSAWPLVIEINERFYFKPEAGRLLASLADETPVEPSDVQPEEIDIATTIDRIETATSLKVGRPSHWWAGLRSFAPDRKPVVGEAADVPGFFWLAGQGGYGIMTSPAMARLITSLVVFRRMPDCLDFDDEQLGPMRFAT